MNGRLYIVFTPLGNLGDLTFRAAETLKSVGHVACEDTRITMKLLNHLGSSAKLISIRQENEESATPTVLRILTSGSDVAYCTDAGAPAVSDPGHRLVARARESGFSVIPLPGPSAVTTALAASGLPADRFHFAGFLSSKASTRRKELEQLAPLAATLVFFEAPHRIAGFLTDAESILGPRLTAVCRELTKIHEEVITGRLGEIPARKEWRGEFTIVIEGAEVQRGETIDPAALRAWLTRQLEESGGRGVKEIARRAAGEMGVSSKVAYTLALSIIKEMES